VRLFLTSRSGVVALTLACVTTIACGGGEMAAPAAEAETAAPAADAGNSHWVDGNLPNPTGEVILNWAPLPEGQEWGSTAGIDVGPDGHIWAYDRCGGLALAGGCEENPERNPVYKFNKDTGEIMASFGAGLFVLPHGLHVDDDGNVWVTDSQGNESGTKGHQVIKFSPEGQELLRLGTAGQPGSGPGQLNEPCDVITASNGDIFVSDGHSGQGLNPPEGATGRILKYDSEGNFIKEWGEIGFRPGQFRTPHAMEIDSQGRLYVADRGNHRIQVFDLDGNAIDGNPNADGVQPLILMAYSRISGLFITDGDTLYAIDSESTPGNHPGWMTGVRIGPAGEDQLTGFVPPHAHQTRVLQGVAGEGVAVDADGNIYAAEGPGSRPTAGGGITKYVAN